MSRENKPITFREPLPYGVLAPDFSLPSITGTIYTREQFRGKQGLVLLFLQQAETHSATILCQIIRLWSEFVEINAQVLTIFEMLPPPAEAFDLPFPMLVDAGDRVWQRYTQESARGAALFVLDTYGALSAQRVVTHVAELPDAEEILALARYTQYRCSV